MSLGIFSFEEDLHALAVQNSIAKRGIECHVFETSLFANRGVSWTPSSGVSSLMSRDGVEVVPSDLRLVWWRKLGQNLRKPIGVEPFVVDFLTNNWRHAIEGVMLESFRGRWVSHPVAQRHAELKVVQLRAALEAGLTIPDTLISTNPEEVREFCRRHGGRIIAKTLRASTTRALATVQLDAEQLSNDAMIRACPTIYQEVVPGNTHVRAHVFGSEVLAARIESPHLDWRRDLSVPFNKCELDRPLPKQLAGLVAALGLRMGIIDLKLRASGEATWIEINPQGQFLFVEGLCGLPLLERFVQFLYNEYTATLEGESEHSTTAISAV